MMATVESWEGQQPVGQIENLQNSVPRQGHSCNEYFAFKAKLYTY